MIIVCARRQHATFRDWCSSSSHRNGTLVHPSVMLLSGLVYTETPLVLFGDVFRPQEVEVTHHGLGVHVWRHRGKSNTSGWCTCAIASKRLVSLHESFQGFCAVYTPGLCTTVCVNTTFAPVDPACARFCCHAIVLNVYGGHVPIWGGVSENGKLYRSQMNLDLVLIIQMIGLWFTAG